MAGELAKASIAKGSLAKLWTSHRERDPERENENLPIPRLYLLACNPRIRRYCCRCTNSSTLGKGDATLGAGHTWLVARKSRARAASKPSHVGSGCQTSGTDSLLPAAAGKLPNMSMLCLQVGSEFRELILGCCRAPHPGGGSLCQLPSPGS